MTNVDATTCPGCGLEMPKAPAASYDGYFNTSPECWSVFTEVIGVEFGDAVVFAAAHQLTVDAYAVQHAGGPHPDRSVGIHLSGLHLALEQGLPPVKVARRLQAIGVSVTASDDGWPHFSPPPRRGRATVLEVALAEGPEDHVRQVRAWAEEVWAAWSEVHEVVARLVSRHLA